MSMGILIWLIKSSMIPSGFMGFDQVTNQIYVSININIQKLYLICLSFPWKIDIIQVGNWCGDSYGTGKWRLCVHIFDVFDVQQPPWFFRTEKETGQIIRPT